MLDAQLEEMNSARFRNKILPQIKALLLVDMMNDLLQQTIDSDWPTSNTFQNASIHTHFNRGYFYHHMILSSQSSMTIIKIVPFQTLTDHAFILHLVRDAHWRIGSLQQPSPICSGQEWLQYVIHVLLSWRLGCNTFFAERAYDTFIQ